MMSDVTNKWQQWSVSIGEFQFSFSGFFSFFLQLAVNDQL
jgi:hypothetical protein